MKHSVYSSSTICDIAQHQPSEQLQCSPDVLVTRTPAYAETSAPQIHFSRFALGDQVTKSGISRDLISKANDMGFEMEGAGTWDIMPTIIIKDVCDHTDSHKNKSVRDSPLSRLLPAQRQFFENSRLFGTRRSMMEE
jgi:hypothetical protein